MSPSFEGFRKTEVKLHEGPLEKPEVLASNDQSPTLFKTFTPEELQNYDSRIVNMLAPWAGDLSHPVYLENQEELAPLIAEVVQPTANREKNAELRKKLDQLWDAWDDRQS